MHGATSLLIAGAAIIALIAGGALLLEHAQQFGSLIPAPAQHELHWPRARHRHTRGQSGPETNLSVADRFTAAQTRGLSPALDLS